MVEQLLARHDAELRERETGFLATLAEQETVSSSTITAQKEQLQALEKKVDLFDSERMDIFRRHALRLGEIGTGVTSWTQQKFLQLEKLEASLSTKLKRYFREVVEGDLCAGLPNAEEERWMVILGLAVPKEAERLLSLKHGVLAEVTERWERAVEEQGRTVPMGGMGGAGGSRGRSLSAADLEDEDEDLGRSGGRSSSRGGRGRRRSRSPSFVEVDSLDREAQQELEQIRGKQDKVHRKMGKEGRTEVLLKLEKKYAKLERDLLRRCGVAVRESSGPPSALTPRSSRNNADAFLYRQSERFHSVMEQRSPADQVMQQHVRDASSQKSSLLTISQLEEARHQLLQDISLLTEAANIERQKAEVLKSRPPSDLWEAGAAGTGSAPVGGRTKGGSGRGNSPNNEDNIPAKKNSRLLSVLVPAILEDGGAVEALPGVAETRRSRQRGLLDVQLVAKTAGSGQDEQHGSSLAGAGGAGPPRGRGGGGAVVSRHIGENDLDHDNVLRSDSGSLSPPRRRGSSIARMTEQNVENPLGIQDPIFSTKHGAADKMSDATEISFAHGGAFFAGGGG